MPIVLFEDRRVEQLHPASLGRPAFAITCGGYRLLDIATMLRSAAPFTGPLHAVIRPYLQAIVKAEFPQLATAEALPDAHTLWLNARLVPSLKTAAVLKKLLADGQPGVVWQGETAAAALTPAGGGPSVIRVTPTTVNGFLENLALPKLEASLALLEYPHDIVRHHIVEVLPSLEHRLQAGEFCQLSNGIFAAEGVQLGEHLVTDVRGGPIVLDRDAQVGPFCHLKGPVYIGPRARLIENSVLKDGTFLCHTTKIGGEIEASIVEPFTNKQHHGFLGHSYLGSWINFGAGTSNSDLKNTYGLVNMRYRGQKVPTGMQFVGCFIGDYAKTAINTGIFTGKTIGACSMVYGFVTTNVPSFVNYARSFGQVTEAPVDVMIATQARMFARRNVQQRECDMQLLRDMHALTQDERLGDPLVPEPLSL